MFSFLYFYLPSSQLLKSVKQVHMNKAIKYAKQIIIPNY